MSDDDFARQDWQEWSAGRQSHFVPVKTKILLLVEEGRCNDSSLEKGMGVVFEVFVPRTREICQVLEWRDCGCCDFCSLFFPPVVADTRPPLFGICSTQREPVIHPWIFSPNGPCGPFFFVSFLYCSMQPSLPASQAE